MTRLTSFIIVALLLTIAGDTPLGDARPDRTNKPLRSQTCGASTYNPLGIDVARPRLSWIIESQQSRRRQDAYQVLVA